MANLKFKDETGKWVSIPSVQGEPGEKGEKGEPGAGIIPGGLAGQYLRKTTDADYETEWADVEGGGMPIICKDDISYSNPFVISTTEPGIYRVGGNDVYIRVLEGGSRNSIRIIDGLIYVLKKYEDAKIDEVFCFYTSDTGRVKSFIKKDNSFAELNGGNGEILRTSYNNSISGQYTYTKLPKSSVTPTEDEQFTNKKYVDDVIANAAPTIDTTTLLNYKGHVASIEDLPSTGQASGTATAEVAIATYDFTENTATTQAETGYDYFISVGNTRVPYRGVISTNFPEIIEWLNIGKYSGDYFVATAYVNASEEKPAYLSGYYESRTGIAVTLTSTGITDARNDGILTEPAIVYFGHLYEATRANSYIKGNLPAPLKYKPLTDKTWYYRHQYANLGTYNYALTGYTSLKLDFADGYTYTDGMQMLAFDPETYKAIWVLNESMATPNEVYTVGDNYDIYHCDDTPKWTPWSQGSSSAEDLPTFVVRGNSKENPIVWSECKKGVYVFEDYTVWYKMDDADSVRKVTVSDYKIYKLYDGIGPNEGKPHFIFFGDIGIYMYNTHTLYSGGNVNGVLMPGNQRTSWTIQGSTFFNYAPQTFKVPASEYDLTNKKYVDGVLSGMPAGSKITKGTTTDDPIIIDELSVGTHFLSTQNNLVYAKASASTSAGYANLTIGPKLLIVIKKFSDVAQDEICAVFITPDLGTGYITKASTASGIGVAVHTTDTDFLTEVVSAWITGSWGFENTVECSATPTSGTHLTNKSYVDTGLGKKQNKVTYGTGDPSGGSDGDVYFKYTA